MFYLKNILEAHYYGDLDGLYCIRQSNNRVWTKVYVL